MRDAQTFCSTESKLSTSVGVSTVCVTEARFHVVAFLMDNHYCTVIHLWYRYIYAK